MPVGVTQSQLFECNDGKLYVIKLKDNPLGVKVLVNELIANRIAQILNLPVPIGNLIWIPPELAVVPSIMQEGKHFGTVLADNALNNPPLDLIEKAINADCIPGIYVLDNYLANSDRHKDNIMVHQTDSGNNILLIDHSLCFESHQWSVEHLHMLVSTVNAMRYYLHQEIAYLVSGTAPFDLWLDILENIEKEQLEDIINEIPSEWNIIEEELEALLLCLISRKVKIRPLLTSIKSQFPNWKD
jgi:hypothetical protein